MEQLRSPRVCSTSLDRGCLILSEPREKSRFGFSTFGLVQWTRNCWYGRPLERCLRNTFESSAEAILVFQCASRLLPRTDAPDSCREQNSVGGVCFWFGGVQTVARRGAASLAHSQQACIAYTPTPRHRLVIGLCV